MIALASRARKSSWIMSPPIDLIVGCGAWSLTLLILAYVFGDMRQNGALAFCTLFLIAVLIAAHGFYGIVPLLMTIYLTWSPWHYMGQNFELMMMFVHRNELKIDRRDRNMLWIAFVAAYLLIFLSIHTGPSTPLWLSIGFPPSLLDALRIPLMVVFFAGVFPLVRLIRQAGFKSMLAPLTLYLTQFLWAVLPSALLKGFGVPQVAYSISMLAVMHCAQYLWITNYYARREAKAESTGWN